MPLDLRTLVKRLKDRLVGHLSTEFALKIERPLLILLAAAGLTAVLSNLEFNLLEAKLYDFRMSHGIQTEPDPSIALIAIDDPTVKALDEFAPLPMDFHAKFMESMEKLDPKAVGYVIDFQRVEQSNPSLPNKEQWAKRFVDAARRMETKGTAVVLGTPFDVTGEVLPPPPMNSLPHSIAVIHKDGNVFAEDKVTRRAMIDLYGRSVFHTELAIRVGAISRQQTLKGTFFVPEVDGNYVFFKYHGNSALAPDSREPLPYTRISFLDVLQGKLSPGALRGKIALVGTLSKEDSGDFAYTPYSKTAFSNPKLAIHANILDSVMHDQGTVRAPKWLNGLVTFAVSSFVIWWVLNSTPLYGLFATLSLALALMTVGQLLFSLKDLWIRLSPPLVGIFVAYYLVVPYRLIREYKKRWDFQRKNELLVQVEELKTNFLSLVTHDLKTPVARIQGLAEVILAKSAERLVERDKESLHHIISSTEELNHFISSILELSKIESNRISLKVESKDVNQIIERLVEGFKAQARSKRIRIQTNLEPMFPIRIDASLISKVISNLIDNALKYSLSGSEIVVQSRENGPWLEISVTDQGIGMTPEEQRNLFTRFYRAKNDTTTKIAGTGLGLYLTKYFVEAHHGRVEVTSEQGKGSVFKILLPLEPSVQPPVTGTAKGTGAIRRILASALTGLRNKTRAKPGRDPSRITNSLTRVDKENTYV